MASSTRGIRVGTPPLSVASAPAAAMAMTYLAMADSLGLAMQNAVNNQQHGQVVASTTTTLVSALILKQGGSPAP